MAISRRAKRIVVLTDSHAGCLLGLVPPANQASYMGAAVSQFWNWYAATVGKLEPADLCIHLGDAVDGEGKKGTVGLYETNTEKQAEIAANTIRVVRAAQYRMIRGTPFHTDGTSAYENHAARLLGCNIDDEAFMTVNGLRIGARHVVSRSGTPYGQGSLLGKEVVRDFLEALEDGEMPSDLVIRGHAHTWCYLWHGTRRGIVAPGLELPRGTPFARTQRPFHYHVGLLELIVEPNGELRVIPHLCPLKFARRREYAEV